MDGYLKIAKLLKERDNIMPFEIHIAKVISPFPDIKLSFDNEKIILDKEDLVFSSILLKDYEREYISKYNGQEGNQRILILKNNAIKLNDEVVIIPLYNNQKYFVVDKVVNL